MTVKELIDKLSGQPQDAGVFYLTTDGGMQALSKVVHALPESDELKEITGDEFVVLE